MKTDPAQRPARSAGPAIARRGVLFVLSSPSGAGKTTLARRLLAAEAGIVLSVSVTTRAPRETEVDGRDYHFIDDATFDRMVADGALLERAEVFGNRYGTPRAAVETWVAEGRDVLFDVDWQGATQLRASPLASDVVSVFILPPSIAELERWLRDRALDAPEVVARRMARARDEIAHCRDYAYIVVNENLDESEATLRGILTAERHRQGRLTGLNPMLGEMMG